MSIQSFSIADPRTFDGDPFEVAERAVRQVEALARLTAQAVDGARLMARNAQLERELLASGECDAVAYDSSAEGLRFDRVKADLAEVERSLGILARAAGYNPKTPLTG